MFSKTREGYKHQEFIYCGCGCCELISSINKLGKPARYKHGHNSKRQNNPNWRGGKYYDDRGYIKISKPTHKFKDIRGYVYEHRLVWEEYNKASLLPWADVHHINGIKNDNAPSNLEAMMKSEHSRISIKVSIWSSH
jgi:hypothetical protein